MATISNDELAIRIVVDDRDADSKIQKTESSFTRLGATVVSVNQGLDLLSRGFSALRSGLQTLDTLVSSAGQVDALARSFESLQASVGQDATTALNNLRDATKGLVSDLDLIQASNRAVQLGLPTEGFEEAAGAAIKLGRAMGIDATQAINDFTTGVGRGSVQILDNLGIIVKANDAYEAFAKANNKLAKDLTETEKKLAFQEAAYKAVVESASNTADITLNASDAYAVAENSLKNLGTELLKGIANNEDLRDAFLEVSKAIEEIDVQALSEDLGQLISFVSRLAATLISKVQPALRDFTRGLRLLGEIQAGIARGDNLLNIFDDARLRVAIAERGEQLAEINRKTIEQRDIQEKLSTEVIPRSIEVLKEQTRATEQQNEVTQEASKVWDGYSEAVGRALQGIASGKGLDIGDLTGDLASVFLSKKGADGLSIGEAIGKDIASSLGDFLPENLAGIGGDIGASIVPALAVNVAEGTVSGIQAALKGDRLSRKEKFALALPTFGGSFIFDDVKKALFGKSNAAANAREFIESVFNDAIRDANLDIQAFNDFGRNSFNPFINAAGEATTLVSEQFRQLDQESQFFFSGIGTALEQVFQIEGLESGQLGELLGANFGVGINSANDLQLILQSMGITAEQVGAQLEAAFSKGTLTAEEFLSGLDATRNILAQGIPDAVGATGEAFDNIVSGALASGQQAMDAFGDTAAEALEKGITSLGQLREDLIAQGKPLEEVDRLFQAYANNGITSLEELRDVNLETSARIIRDLNNQGFGFDRVSESIADLQGNLEQIKSKSVDIDVNIRTNADSTTREFSNIIVGDSGGLGGV